MTRNALAMAVVCVALSAAQGGATEVVVTTDSGASHAGIADARTDARRLWLRRDEANIALAFSVDWESIQSATVGGAAVAPSELQSYLADKLVHRPALDVLLGPTTIGERPLAQPTQRRVVAIHVRACVGQWDADVQADGIELLVVAVDDAGRPVPVRGELTARLLGEQQATRHTRRYGGLARWTEPVRKAQFDGRGEARFRLPFRTIEPDADWRLGPDAVVNVTLGVFGQGRFSASAPVRLRSFSPLRDRLQQQTGSRRFAEEEPRGTPGRSYRYGSALWSDP